MPFAKCIVAGDILFCHQKRTRKVPAISTRWIHEKGAARPFQTPKRRSNRKKSSRFAQRFFLGSPSAAPQPLRRQLPKWGAGMAGTGNFAVPTKSSPLRGKTSPGRGKMSRSDKRGNLAHEVRLRGFCPPPPRRRFQRKQARQMPFAAQTPPVKTQCRAVRRPPGIALFKIFFPLKMRRATRRAF